MFLTNFNWTILCVCVQNPQELFNNSPFTLIGYLVLSFISCMYGVWLYSILHKQLAYLFVFGINDAIECNVFVLFFFFEKCIIRNYCALQQKKMRFGATTPSLHLLLYFNVQFSKTVFFFHVTWWLYSNFPIRCNEWNEHGMKRNSIHIFYDWSVIFNGQWIVRERGKRCCEDRK